MEHAAALGANLGHCGAGRIVNQNIELGQGLRGLVDIGPLLGANAAHAEVTDRDHGVGANQTLGNFLARHLQREEADGITGRGSVERQIQGERRLTHSRAGADDDELALAKTHEHAIERREARGHARSLAACLAHFLGLVIGLDHKLGQRLVARLDLARRDLEQLALGQLHDLFGIGGSVIGQRVDLVGGADQLTQHRIAANDSGMVLPVDERQGLTHQLQNVGLAAHGIKLVDASQVIDQRDGVDGNAAVVHIDHRGIDGLMNGPVEVIGLQLDLGLFDHLGR